MKDYSNFDLKDIPEFGISKTNFAELLGVSRKSIFNYHKIALDFCGDFSSDYPALGNYVFTESPLTTYQCWVLWKIYVCVHLRKIPVRVLQQRLEEDVVFYNSFSKRDFLKFYDVHEIDYEYIDVEINNDITSICRVA